MVRRFLIVAAIAAQSAWFAPSVNAVGVFVQLFPLTGEIRLRNKDAASFDFVLYSITSPNGALNSSPSVWKSISDFYDDSGSGFIDATNNWTKLSATAMELSEGVIPNPGGILPGMRAISLGNVWNPNLVPTPDLSAEFEHPDGETAIHTIEFAVDGDYVADGVVDQLDYNLWRQFFGSTSVLLADGDLNGVVDAGDYVVWRNNRGNMLPPGFSIGSVSAARGSLIPPAAIPEPASAVLLFMASGGLFYWIARSSRRR